MAEEYDERYEGNGGGDHAAAAEYGAAPAGGSPPPAKPSGFSDHADGRSAQPLVSSRAIWVPDSIDELADLDGGLRRGGGI